VSSHSWSLLVKTAKPIHSLSCKSFIAACFKKRGRTNQGASGKGKAKETLQPSSLLSLFLQQLEEPVDFIFLLSHDWEDISVQFLKEVDF
jgi:hypothetical protein